MKKSSHSKEEVKLALGIILTNIQVIPSEDILAKFDEAEEIMCSIDRYDAPFVAAALSMACDGILSDDKDLKRQKKVKVWRTSEIMSFALTLSPPFRRL